MTLEDTKRRLSKRQQATQRSIFTKRPQAKPKPYHAKQREKEGRLTPRGTHEVVGHVVRRGAVDPG
jgi:hypothetical protein